MGKEEVLLLATFQYEVFLEVVESGSFTKAGEKLGLTQSGVSHNILTLEGELGVVLLHRNRNGISLTDAGERVIPHIRQIIHHARLLEQEAALIKGIEVGRIKIGSFPSFSAKFLPGLMNEFKRVYPGIKIELYEGDYDIIKSWIASGTIDIGFIALPADEFETIQLLKDKLVVLVNATHTLSNSIYAKDEAINNEAFIMPKSGCEVLIKDFLKQNKIKPDVAFEVHDNNTIISMVQEDLGISILPELVVPENIPNAKVIPLEKEVYREIGLAVKSIKQASPSLKKFMEIVKARFRIEKT
ncbi:LysR family transcriptional regulator [Bacillus sp. EAC]|uniref:LysR family transcriptional regulator n=1 Tax=Bacillus sp. EAC TaxID=1978338 RepID=UPI000B45168C|nr:LysR family transcriptional regulator [Bacillus sp. EAC]